MKKKKNNKLIWILITAIILIGGLWWLNQYTTEKKLVNNPYEKNDLNPATISQIGDPNYKNQILPLELDEKIKSGENMAVYYYSPTCPYCIAATPKISELEEEYGINVYRHNLLEFENSAYEYEIQGTPTLVHYINGEEVARISGNQDVDTFAEFIKVVKNKAE